LWPLNKQSTIPINQLANKVATTATKSDINKTFLELIVINFQPSYEVGLHEQQKMELGSYQLSNYLLVLVIFVSSSNCSKGKVSLCLFL